MVMETLSDLEVDVNGQHTFWINKRSLADFSTKIDRTLAQKDIDGNTHRAITTSKITFQDFPGGPEGFDLIAQFCYNKGSIKITHHNVIMLATASTYMEMNKPISGKPSLITQTNKFLKGIDFWTWSELMLALKQVQKSNLLIFTNERPSIMQKLVSELVRRLALLVSDPSSKCTSFRSSCDSRNTTTSSKTNTTCFQTNWFFKDLSELDIGMIDMVVKEMVAGEKFHHSTITSFLVTFLKSRVLFDTIEAEKVQNIEGVIRLISLLDQNCISIKSLLGILRMSTGLKLSKPSRQRLEKLIGSQLDQVSLDYLFIPSTTPRKNGYYNVELVLRLLKIFLQEVHCRLCQISLESYSPLTRVAGLIDLYAMEVAPDDYVKPVKFAALVTSLPDSARDSCDQIYEAIEMYFQVNHSKLCEEQKNTICHALNYDKLSPDILVKLSQDLNFPIQARAKALVYQNSRLHMMPPTYNTRLKVFDSWESGCTARFIKNDEIVGYLMEENGQEMRQMGWIRSVFHLQRHFARKRRCCSSENDSNKYLPKLCS